MSLVIQIARQCEFPEEELQAMYRLRAQVFREQMGWDIPVTDGMDIDLYDECDPHYMLVRGRGGQVCGCWRLLPTTGPYMLRSTFPQLLYGQEAPCDPAVWELSRFTIQSEGRDGYGFSQIALEAFAEAGTYARRLGIQAYVIVTTVAIERMLRRTGMAIHRYGPPLRIGVETAVALRVDIAASEPGFYAHCAQLALEAA